MRLVEEGGDRDLVFSRFGRLCARDRTGAPIPLKLRPLSPKRGETELQPRLTTRTTEKSEKTPGKKTSPTEKITSFGRTGLAAREASKKRDQTVKKRT